MAAKVKGTTDPIRHPPMRINYLFEVAYLNLLTMALRQLITAKEA